MYKKIIIGICALCVVSTGVYATGDLTSRQIKEQPNIDQQAMGNLNSTNLRFCNDNGKSVADNLRLYLTSRPGGSQKICTVFFNNMDQDTNFYIGFTQATQTTDGLPLCDSSTTKNEFSKLIMEDYTIKIPIKAHMQIEKIFTVTIPKTSTGDVLGCLAYSIDGSSSHQTGEVFGMIIRKVAPINITVTGAVYNFGRRDDTKDAYTANKSIILKIVVAILGIWIIVSIVQTVKKKEKKHHKKK